MRPIRLPVLVLLIAACAAPAAGMVIRHDRDDARYRELGALYPAAVRVIPDGAGVLVAPRWVLTAAHVARGVAQREPRVEVGRRIYRVEALAVHPEWKRMGPHDIALLRLDRPVVGVQPVGLYAGDDEAGLQATFVGHGDTGTGETGPRRADGMLRGATNIVDVVDEDWVHFDFDAPGDATDLEGVSGPGDSGGPALVEIDGATWTIGVSVFSDGKGRGPGRYGIREGYTRVSTHVDWLRKVLTGEIAAQPVGGD